MYVCLCTPWCVCVKASSNKYTPGIFYPELFLVESKYFRSILLVCFFVESVEGYQFRYQTRTIISSSCHHRIRDDNNPNELYTTT